MSLLVLTFLISTIVTTVFTTVPSFPLIWQTYPMPDYRADFCSVSGENDEVWFVGGLVDYRLSNRIHRVEMKAQHQIFQETDGIFIFVYFFFNCQTFTLLCFCSFCFCFFFVFSFFFVFCFLFCLCFRGQKVAIFRKTFAIF